MALFHRICLAASLLMPSVVAAQETAPLPSLPSVSPVSDEAAMRVMNVPHDVLVRYSTGQVTSSFVDTFYLRRFTGVYRGTHEVLREVSGALYIEVKEDKNPYPVPTSWIAIPPEAQGDNQKVAEMLGTTIGDIFSGLFGAPLNDDTYSRRALADADENKDGIITVEEAVAAERRLCETYLQHGRVQDEPRMVNGRFIIALKGIDSLANAFHFMQGTMSVSYHLHDPPDSMFTWSPSHSDDHDAYLRVHTEFTHGTSPAVQALFSSADKNKDGALTSREAHDAEQQAILAYGTRNK